MIVWVALQHIGRPVVIGWVCKLAQRARAMKKQDINKNEEYQQPAYSHSGFLWAFVCVWDVFAALNACCMRQCMSLIKLFLRRIFYEPLNNRAVNKKMDEEQNSWLWYKVFSMDIHTYLFGSVFQPLSVIVVVFVVAVVLVIGDNTNIFYNARTFYVLILIHAFETELTKTWKPHQLIHDKKKHTIRVKCVCMEESECCLLNWKHKEIQRKWQRQSKKTGIDT